MKRSKNARAFFNRLLRLLIALVCVFAFIPTAHAEEARINITANPTELTDTGNVTFTFEIANYNADYPMSDVMITYNGTVYDVLHGAQIPPSGSARDITLNLNVTQSQLGKPITFLVTWTRNGEPMSQQAQYTIAQAENPIITVTRTADKTNAKPGEKVSITYTLKNTTKFDMTEITLIDENISDMPIFEDETLRASRTISYDYVYIMGDESVTSTPIITYSVNSKVKTFSSLEPLELTMVLIQLDMRVTEGTPTSTGVTFTIDLVNTGTQAISNILLTDERGNAANDKPFDLAPQESRSLSYIVVPLMTEPLRNVQFKLSGIDPFAQPYELAPADIYEVYPYVDASQINVTVRAETVTPWTADSKKLTARIVITNHSSVELTNITVSETTIGVIKDYDILAAGETSFDQEIQLGTPRNLNITVKGYDPTGANRALANCVMPVAYGTETAAPATPSPEQDGGSNFNIFGSINSGIMTVLIILGVLMVLSVIILIALTAMERAKRPRGFIQDDEDDYIEPEIRTTKHAFHDVPDPEEIRYTQRMFAMKNEEQQGQNQESILLPAAPPVRPAEQPPVIFASSSPRPQESEPRVEELAQKFVETARTRYTEAQSTASYRPASEAVKPYTPPTQPRPKVQPSIPRVFDYKKQPKPQSTQKLPVTRVPKGARGIVDDEE
ncbi:MAG: hypothetical protein C0413_02890 [Clostridiales bacterium]|nr:hypothetical protein [Clostridiales bacterium]